MRSSRSLLVAVLVTWSAALLASSPAGSKEGVRATLTSDIPLPAPAGDELTVGWKLFSFGRRGERVPFGASGVFVRLLSSSGASFAEGLDSSGAHPTGEYEATVVVPEGGIGDVEIGLVGWRSDAEGTHRSDALFPITNDPVPGAARSIPSVPVESISHPSGSGGVTRTFALAAMLLGLVALFGLVALRRKRSARLTTAR